MSRRFIDWLCSTPPVESEPDHEDYDIPTVLRLQMKRGEKDDLLVEAKERKEGAGGAGTGASSRMRP